MEFRTPRETKECEYCGNINESWCWVCAKCGKGLSTDHVTNTVTWKAEPANFELRFKAWFVDSLIVLIVSRIPVAAVNFSNDEPAKVFYEYNLVFIAFIFIVQALYHIGFWTFGGQTPGKMWAGIAVVRDDGSPIGFFGSIGRYAGYFLSEATLGIGYLMILWDSKNQGLHDKIAGTLVIRDTKHR